MVNYLWINNVIGHQLNSRTVESRKAAAETRKFQRKRAAIEHLEHGHESQFGPPDKKQLSR